MGVIVFVGRVAVLYSDVAFVARYHCKIGVERLEIFCYIYNRWK